MSDNMKFVILGAGNIGTLIGAKLAQLESSSVLIHTRGEHAASLAVNGITVSGLETFHLAPNEYLISISDVEINSVFDDFSKTTFENNGNVIYDSNRAQTQHDAYYLDQFSFLVPNN